MTKMINQTDIETLFLNARSQNGWLDKAVSETQITQIYDLLKFAPTAANCSPLRLVFIKSDDAKQRLKPLLDEGNIDKAMTAPVVAILAYDTQFYEQLPTLFPHTDARSWFAGKPEKIIQAGTTNATLQIAYFIMAARSIGLDCGPMGGFDAAGVDKEFFTDKAYKSLLICGVGYGDDSKVFPRSPRLDFSQTCTII